jgi:N-dimethylarginine dimethylaminohydrolase
LPRVIGLAMLVVGAIIVGMFTPALFPPKWRIIADDAGSIRRVVCLVNSARHATLRNASAITSVVNALPVRTRVVILTNDRQAFIVARNTSPERVTFLDLPDKSAFSIWPQDPFVVLAAKHGKPVLLSSREFTRADDRLIARNLAKHLGWECRQSELTFEGGNIVPARRHVFIGANTVFDNAEKSKLPPARVVRKFRRELGRSVIVLGPVPQPVGHIDMMITPLDDRRLLLADPRWGARLAKDELKKHPKDVIAFERYCEDYYFGGPAIKVLYDPKGKSILPPKVVGQTSKAVTETLSIANDLDKLAGSLEKRGYEVWRVPFLSRTDTISASKKEAVPEYPCLTYNNVLMETAGKDRIVYLPQYGWPAMDEAASKVWRKAGYRVVPVYGLTISSMYGGSLRCCVKVVERSVSY